MACRAFDEIQELQVAVTLLAHRSELVHTLLGNLVPISLNELQDDGLACPTPVPYHLTKH